MSLLLVEDLFLRFRGQARPAVDGLSFAVERGEIFGLLGPSGSGKTSTLRMIAGFERPERGRIVLDGRAIEGDGAFVPPERRNVGFVFQEFALFPHLTVMENVMFGLHGLPRGERAGRAMEILERAQLAEHAARYPRQLSGGQQQRVALARAMAPRPHVILMDEPFGSLDPDLREDARRKIADVFREHAMSAVFVTHDQTEALGFADRIGVMREGRIEQVGTPEELYNKPRTRFVASFIGGSNILSGIGRGDCVMTPIGRVPIDRDATGNVTIALRPEHLQLEAATAGEPSGQVVSRVFHGHDLTIRVAFAEAEVSVWDDYRCPFRVGEAVRVRPREKGVVVE
ncbi:MAG TPA: ABC transporter ATP-binding protein [Candidatus Krumholzibacteria bacterium]|nr:ABC transporter ATP-binding protein [Candidatus Krumholzibacteria bacterium]